MLYRERSERVVLEPKLDELDKLCLEAWNRLSTCRGIGMDVGPIPMTATLEWCAFKQFDRDVTQLVLDVIDILDEHRARLVAAKRALEKPQGGKRR